MNERNEQFENEENILEKYSKNISALVREGKIDPIIGREEEIRSISRILSRRTKNNPILIGEPGVGKTAIVEGLAHLIEREEVPTSLLGKTIYELDLSSVLAGASFQGQFEQRLKSIIKKVEKSNGEIILFIDEIHTLIGAGKTSGAMDAANILKPAMARGTIKVIGATTLKEYKHYIEKDAALERRLQKILVEEPNREDSINILRGIKEKYELFHGVRIHDNALISAVDFSIRYIQDRFLPDKAIDLIDEACSLVKSQIQSKPEELEKVTVKILKLKVELEALKNEKDLKSIERLEQVKKEISQLEPIESNLFKSWNEEKEKISRLKTIQHKIEELNKKAEVNKLQNNFGEVSKIVYDLLPKAKQELEQLEKETESNQLIKEEVNQNTIATIVSRLTLIPIQSLVENDKEKLLNLTLKLKEMIKGQDEACDLVSQVIKKSRVGINDPNKPIGSFIFMGPTGTGKTELAKSLARILFNSEKEMIRFDMSEFSEKHSVAKLIGSPAGYIGYEEGGLLTEAVRRKPYSIILFDEIEKAHPDISNTFLQVLDDGMLTDNQGRHINFKNTLIIFTTNIGSEKISKNSNLIEDEKINILRNYFRPEFINRIDEIIVFKKLERNIVNEITKKELNLLKSRLKDKNYLFEFSDKCIEKISIDGFDELFGARPIKKYISRNIETLISDAIIKGEIKENINYLVSVNAKKIVIDLNK